MSPVKGYIAGALEGTRSGSFLGPLPSLARSRDGRGLHLVLGWHGAQGSRGLRGPACLACGVEGARRKGSWLDGRSRMWAGGKTKEGSGSIEGLESGPAIR